MMTDVRAQRRAELEAEGWTYLETQRADRTADDLSQALAQAGAIPEGNVITMHFTFDNYCRNHEGRLELLAVQVL